MTEKIKKIIEHSTKNVEYYRRINLPAICKIEEIPLLSRDTLQNYPLSLISDQELSNLDNLLIKSSSGSSGTPTNVYWSQSGYIQSMFCLWKRRMKFHNISPYSVELDFTYPSIEPNDWHSIRRNRISVSRSILDDSGKMEELFYYINRLNVEWMYLQPYVCMKMMAYINENKVSLPKSLRYVEFVGEILSKEIRDAASTVFKVPNANMYGSEEMNGIAYECPYGNLHVLNDNVFVETSYKNEGEIYITNLTNYTMPLLRYRQGDIVELSDGVKCKCGCSGVVIKAIFGRSYEMIKMNQCRINPYMLISVMEYINEQQGGYINQYKFIWNSRAKRMFLLIHCRSHSDFIRGNIKELVIKMFSNLHMFVNLNDIVFVDEIPKDLGKYSILKIIGGEIHNG